MGKFKNFSLAMVITSLVAACMSVSSFDSNNSIKGSDNYIAKSVEIEDFSTINTSKSIDVYYVQSSDSVSAVVYAPDNLVDLIELKVVDGELRVSYVNYLRNKSIILQNKGVEVRVNSPKLRGVKASTSANVIIDDGLQSGDFTVDCNTSAGVKINGLRCDFLRSDVNTSGDVELLDIDCHSVKSQASTSGSCTIKGRAKMADLSASTSADIFAGELLSDKTKASASTSALIKCSSKGDVSASESTSARVVKR